MTRKMMIPLRIRALIPTIAIGLWWPTWGPNAQAMELNLYAGPQSVSPGEIIYVTVQSIVPETTIELSYNSDDGSETQIARTSQGLVSFEVPAQNAAEQMRFIAKSGERVSNIVFVSVFAAAPQDFVLNTEVGTRSETLHIWSAVITDAFENPISDLALVSLDWVDDKGLIAAQNAQLTQGRIIVNAECPIEFDGTLRLRAAVHSAVAMSSDISSLCREAVRLDVR